MQSSRTPAVTRIAPRARWGLPDAAELWRSRELVLFLALRNVQVRYKQTILGATWAVLQPVLTTGVFTIFFGRLAGVPSDGVPYYLFSLTAMVPFTYAAGAFEQGANSLVAEASLVTKVYFPRLALPLSYVASALVDFAAGFAVLLVAVLVGAGGVPARVLLIPAWMLIAIATTTGLSLLFAAFNAQFRDIKHTLPFVRQMWLFVTPIAYPASLLDEGWRLLYAVNPMVGVVEGFRWSLLPVDTHPGDLIVVSALSAVVVLLIGAVAFRRVESILADVV